MDRHLFCIQKGNPGEGFETWIVGLKVKTLTDMFHVRQTKLDHPTYVSLEMASAP
jgi:hypothetical protein